MQPVLERSFIDNPLTFDVGLIQLSFIPVCSPNIYICTAIFQSNCAEGTLVLFILEINNYIYTCTYAFHSVFQFCQEYIHNNYTNEEYLTHDHYNYSTVLQPLRSTSAHLWLPTNLISQRVP